MFYFPGMTSLFQAFVLQKLQKRGEKRLQYGKNKIIFGCRRVALHCALRKSSFNMTRGGGDEDIEGGGVRKFLDTWKGGSEKIRGGSENLYTLNSKGGGAPKKLNR